MNQSTMLAERFETQRPRLRAVAYRMLGSLAEADDIIQETWLRLGRVDADEIGNLGGWLTTTAGRLCLDQLRARTSRREDSLDVRFPEPILDPADEIDPEHEALLADSVGLAMLLVLETLSPAERLVFVLHDMFDVPYAQIGAVVGRTSNAAKQLASRARRRVRDATVKPEPDRARQRAAVDAILDASRRGDFDALIAVLDPEIVLRASEGAASPISIIRGAATVASQAVAFARLAPVALPVLVNGLAGVVSVRDGELSSVASFTVAGGRIVAIDILSDPERLRAIDVPAFERTREQ